MCDGRHKAARDRIDTKAVLPRAAIHAAWRAKVRPRDNTFGFGPISIVDIRNGRHSHRRMKAAPKNDDPTRFLPVGVRKSYFLLSKADRDVLNIALGKYQPAKSELILVGGARLLKPALRLLTLYRLRID